MIQIIGMFNLAAGIEGYMPRNVPIPFRLIAVASGLFTDIAGLGLIALVIASQGIGRKREKWCGRELKSSLTGNKK